MAWSIMNSATRLQFGAPPRGFASVEAAYRLKPDLAQASGTAAAARVSAVHLRNRGRRGADGRLRQINPVSIHGLMSLRSNPRESVPVIPMTIQLDPTGHAVASTVPPDNPIRVVGRLNSPESHDVRVFLTRNEVPH
jgi:hypothetical protein